MKILLYTDSDAFAGTERHILDLATGLIAQSAEATIGCPANSPLAQRAKKANIPLLHIPKRGLIDFNAISILSEQLKADRFDVIHAHNGRTHIAAAMAVKTARRGRCVITQHFLAPARTSRVGPKAWISSYLHRKAAAYTAHTVAISEAVRQAAIARGDCLPNAITTVLNGASAPDLTLAPDPALLRNLLKMPAGAPMIFCAARLQKEKDIPTLLSAMHLLSSRVPTARCFIAGEGDQAYTLYRQHTRLRLANTDLLGFRDDVPAFLRACDVFVLPSLAEPFGLVLLEAMAFGKPVIATNTGGPPEIVKHDTTGLLVPPSDPAALAHAMATLLENDYRRQTMGAAALERFKADFSVTRMAADTLRVYENLKKPVSAK